MLFLSLFSNNLPDFFIIERQGDAGIAKPETDIDRHNATFVWTNPTFGHGQTGMLQKAPLPEGFVLQIATFDDFHIIGKFFDVDDPALKEEIQQESTFVVERGLIDPNQFSFRSVKFPNRFIRHRDFQLFAEPVNTPNELQSATFRHAPPLLTDNP
jgi:hypothetical protein